MSTFNFVPPPVPIPEVWGDPTSMFQTGQQLVATSETFLAQLTAQAGQLAAPVINPLFPTVANAPTPGEATTPNLIDVVWNVPQEPGPFTGQLVIPTFNNVAPVLVATAPGSFVWVEPAPFTSTLLTSLETDLNNAITQGTNLSLPNAAQQAILDAAYEREYRQNANAIAELDRMAALGYAFPPGSFIDARVKMQTELAYTTAGLSREIMATQYKTQLENLVSARQAAASLEGKLIDYANEVTQRVFSAVKYATEAAIAIYSANIEAYKSEVEAFTALVNAEIGEINAQVAVFRGQVDGYVAQLQGYDSAVKGMVGQAEAANLYNTAQAEVFKAQVAAITSYNGTLTAQWEAVIREQEAITQIGVSAAKANGDLYIAARGLSLDASKVGAQVNAQLGAAALGAISWHTSAQTSTSQSASNSTSQVLSDSSSDSTSSSTSNITSISTSNSNVTSNSTSNITEEIAQA